MTMQTIQLPWDRWPLSQNDRHHWRGKASRYASAVMQARACTRQAKTHAVDVATIELHWRMPDRRRRDADNGAPTLKAALDALVAEGVLADDGWAFVPAVTIRLHEPDGNPRMWLEVHEI